MSTNDKYRILYIYPVATLFYFPYYCSIILLLRCDRSAVALSLSHYKLIIVLTKYTWVILCDIIVVFTPTNTIVKHLLAYFWRLFDTKSLFIYWKIIKWLHKASRKGRAPDSPGAAIAGRSRNNACTDVMSIFTIIAMLSLLLWIELIINYDKCININDFFLSLKYINYDTFMNINDLFLSLFTISIINILW